VVKTCGLIQDAGSPVDCLDNPNSVFESAAVKATHKVKYMPKVIDGCPVETTGVQNKITFELAES